MAEGLERNRTFVFNAFVGFGLVGETLDHCQILSWQGFTKSTGVGLVQMLLTPEDLHLKVYSDSDLTRFTWNPKGAVGDKVNALKKSKHTKRTIVKIAFWTHPSLPPVLFPKDNYFPLF